jgi:hypothetical protein
MRAFCIKGKGAMPLSRMKLPHCEAVVFYINGTLGIVLMR